MRRIAGSLLEARAPNAVNFLENLLGLGYGILRARRMAASHTHLHAVWASAPAAAAWALHQLTGIPYSLAGHAYDLYEHGGDGWLPLKLESARMVRTSTLDGQQRWIRLGAEPERVRVIRRGLPEMPPFDPDWSPAVPFRILAVGRMVEKMGTFQLLDILSRLRQTGFPFEATLVGDGPLAPRIREHCIALGLEEQVRFTGALPYLEVEDWYRWADGFVFAGRVARSGDRAGFPNAIGEAMAWGLPVVAAPVGAVGEGIRHGETGLLFREPDEAVRLIRMLGTNPERGRQLRQAARLWVEDAFDARRNVATLVREILKAHPQTRF
jgi:glycosyltransferase involved in cell wall biosynthesis